MVAGRRRFLIGGSSLAQVKHGQEGRPELSADGREQDQVGGRVHHQEEVIH